MQVTHFERAPQLTHDMRNLVNDMEPKPGARLPVVYLVPEPW